MAIVRKVEESDTVSKTLEVTEFEALSGSGLKGVIDGISVSGGNMLLTGGLAEIPEEMGMKADKLSEEGKTPLFFVRGSELLGVIAVADTIKEDSPQAIAELENIAGVLPGDKERVIRELRERGNVIMVGDGINDAPALTSADIGIAIGAGSDVAIDAADVVLMKSSLLDVPAAIRMSRATLRNIHENLFWAFFYNSIGIPLAAGELQRYY